MKQRIESDDNKKQLYEIDKQPTCDQGSNFSDLDKGWSWAILFASFASFCLIGGTMNGVGIIHATFLEMFGESISVTSWVGALHSAVVMTGGPLSSALIDRYSCRVAIMTSGILYVIGCLGTAFAPNIKVAMFTYGIIAGLGGGCGYTACMVVVGFNFNRWRNVALGIALSGMGIGLFAMAPIMQFSRQYYGNMGFFIVLAAATANLIAFGAMCFPSQLEINAQLKRIKDAKIHRDTKTKACFSFLHTYKHVLLNKAIICLCFCMFTYAVGHFLVFLHLPSYIISKEFSLTKAAYAMSILGISNLIGRLLTGALANWRRIEVIVFYSGSMAIVCLATFLYPMYNATYAGHITYSVIFGLFYGNCFVVMTAVNLKHVGINYMAFAIGLQYFFGGIGAGVGPVLAGYIIDTGGTYEQSFIVSACFLLLATLSGAATIFLTKDGCLRKKAKDSADAQCPLGEMEIFIEKSHLAT